MMSRRGVIGVLAGGAAMAGLGGCNPFYARASYRYRMRVEGQYGGSVVYEVLAEKDRFILISEQLPGGSILKGEALVIETPSGPVFVLMKKDGNGRDLISAVTHALAPDIPAGGQKNFWKAVNRLGGWFGGKAELPRADWPLMVRFRDIDDPRSVERVEPEAIGVRRILLEVTSDRMTTGIEKRLGWLSSQRGTFTRRLSAADPSNPPLAARLTKMEFSTEIGHAE